MLHGYQTWSEEPLMQVKDYDDLHGGQKLTEVKLINNAPCMATKLGQKNRWCKFRMMMTFMEAKGQQRSNIVTIDPWPHSQKNC